MQISKSQSWEPLGCILRAADTDVSWLHAYTGASFALPSNRDPDEFDLYVSGRDAHNRSLIGRVTLRLGDAPVVLDIDPEPALGLGQKGTFDENGVSYPCLVEDGGDLYLLYTGWVPGVLTAFQNDLGLARQCADGRFERVSRAPILPRSDGDYLGIGSSFALHDSKSWRLWYTSFQSWGSRPEEPKHTYWIKYATSTSLLDWSRKDSTAVGLEHDGEYVVCRPSVLREGDEWHMWYCWRGEHYDLGYAVSTDGIEFERRDAVFEMERSKDGFDSYERCYPHVFRHDGEIYMVYCGNAYGKEGLGLARLR